MRASLIAVVVLALGAGAAAAAGVSVATGLLATSSKTLTHTSCTVTGALTDITIDQAHPTVTNNTSQLTVLATSGSQKWALLKFSLASCPNIANASVDSATLRLYVTSSTGSGHILKAHKIDTSTASNWSSTTNWNTKPPVASAASSSVTPVTGAWAQFDVTNDVNDVVQTSPTVLPPYTAAAYPNGWAIDDEGTSRYPVTMNATESSTNKPQLVVAYAY